jgi:glycosyltransferase involved in cell wall biosynthesis
LLEAGTESTVTLVDDYSTDRTRSVVSSHALASQISIIENDARRGAAWSRHVAILQILEPDSVVVLIDLDDWISPKALKRIVDTYTGDTRVLATFGNWVDDAGNQNPHNFYSPEEIDRGLVRRIRPFKATHLRTFRRSLYDAVSERSYLGPDGAWLTLCTDVALVFPLLDQCKSENVRWIEEPIYVYRKNRKGGTQDEAMRQGVKKNDILDFISRQFNEPTTPNSKRGKSTKSSLEGDSQ